MRRLLFGTGAAKRSAVLCLVLPVLLVALFMSGRAIHPADVRLTDAQRSGIFKLRCLLLNGNSRRRTALAEHIGFLARQITPITNIKALEKTLRAHSGVFDKYQAIQSENTRARFRNNIVDYFYLHNPLQRYKGHQL